MKGLLLKDLYVMKKYMRSFLLIVMGFSAISVFSENAQFFVIYGMLMTAVTGVSLISYDERFHWDVYSSTMPLSRAQAVTEKYLLNFIFVLLWLPVTLLIQRLGRFTGGFEEPMFLISVALSMGLISPAILYPIIFALGSEKGRLVYYFVIIAMMMFVGGVSGLDSVDVLSELSPAVNAVFILLPLVLYLLSWRLAILLYSRRSL